MDLQTLFEIYSQLTDAEKILFLIVGGYAVFKGIIKLPFLSTTKKSIDKYKTIWNIKTKETLYEQMNIVEVSHASIMFVLKKAYLNLNVTDNHAQHYELITQDAQRECKNVIRKWLKENHYTSRTETEFNIYVDEKIESLLEIVTYHFDLKYGGRLGRKSYSGKNIKGARKCFTGSIT